MRNPLLRRPLAPAVARCRISAANWAARILLPHAIVQAAILYFFVESRGNLITYLPVLSIVYYWIFVQALLSTVPRLRVAERLSTLLLSMWFAPVTWLAVFVLCLPLVTFSIGTIMMAITVFPALRAPVHVVPVVAVFAAGGAMFGYGMHLGLHGSDEGRWHDIRFRAHVSGGALGAALIGAVLLMALYRDLAPTDPERWLWRSIVAFSVLPHVFLTWRAYNRSARDCPAVSGRAGS